MHIGEELNSSTEGRTGFDREEIHNNTTHLSKQFNY
jgi:hypothetical protein